MDKQDRALVKETRALINEIEAGETDRAAWIAVQDRVRQLYEDRTQPEVGKLIGKSQSWVGRLLAWDPDDRDHHAPFAWPERTTADTKHRARKALRDPELRAEVMESLPENERLQIAEAALEPEAKRLRRAKKERHAVQQQRNQPRPETDHLALIANRLGAVESDLMRAIRWAKETDWSEEGTADAEALIDRVAMRLELLRTAVRGDEGLDAELAKILEGAE